MNNTDTENEIIEYKLKEQNEEYQLIFNKFMITLLSDYPKYLFKSKPIKENKENKDNENDVLINLLKNLII